MKEIEDYIDSAETIKILQNLIRINSINPSLAEGAPGELKIAEYIYEELNDIGLNSSLLEVQKDRPNVIGVLNSHKKKTLMLNGHTDTVGVDHMQIDPFTPTIKGNKIFGRGACDMKGGLAAMLSAVRAVVNSGIKLKGNVILTAVIDEEYKSIGTETLVKNYTADAAIVCEPTDLQVATAHKGYVWIEIETQGKAAHGSKPEIGVDAIAKMGKILIEIEKLQQTYTRKVHQLVGIPSIHTSLIMGGRELSTYPDRCKLYLERRTLPNENEREVKREIREILQKLSVQDSQLTANCKLIFKRGALEVSSETEISRKLRTAIIKVTTKEATVTGLSGWFDSEILYNARIPVVIFGPGTIEHAHSADEHVSLDQVITAAKILSRTIVDFCK